MSSRTEIGKWQIIECNHPLRRHSLNQKKCKTNFEGEKRMSLLKTKPYRAARRVIGKILTTPEFEQGPDSTPDVVASILEEYRVLHRETLTATIDRLARQRIDSEKHV